MYVHRSNQTERLFDALAEVVATPLPDPMARELIAVQGRGMERWLSMRLARRFGVWANPEFPFPRHLVQQQLRIVLGDEALDDAFEPESLRWAIAAKLPGLLEHPELVPLRRYLEGDTSSFRRFQLAERIAALYDQYLVFRPELILRWEKGADSHWQALLWRELTQARTPAHIATCARTFLATLKKGGSPPPGLPARICLFGLSTLAPVYVRILEALSRWTETHLFILSPSREFWAEIRSQRDSLRRMRTHPGEGDVEATLRREAGNPLLASLGRLGREFQEVLEAETNYDEGDADLYVEPGATTMLSTLQADVLHLRYRADGSDPKPLGLADESIAVHACHSATREVEVLHEQLRHLFETDKSLNPQDVIVMSPDIDAYAPLIEAVFGGEDGRNRIPYRIADRRLRATEEVVHALLSILGVMGGRMTASQLVDLLELDAVRTRFGIAAAQLDDLRAWIKGAAIRWGIDAEHRRLSGQPEIDTNTWEFGLDRLLLGYAMPGGGRRMFAGVLPYDDIEGTGAVALGALAEFCDVLFGYHRDFERGRTVQAWCDALEHLLADMLAADLSRAYQHQQIRIILGSIAKQAAAGGFEDEVELETMRSCLEDALDQQAPGRNFLSGGVTFCALVPMRTIPFEVVCLLGLNDGVFPRSRRRLAFDLMSRNPQPGDRSSRDDDRYLFLEALLSARRKLVITYVGQSVHDNSEQPPSVVVNELLDTVDESFTQPQKPLANPDRQMGLFDRPVGGNRKPSERILSVHPLQPFSPRYFREPRRAGIVSYSRRHYEAAHALIAEREHGAAPFISGPLPTEEPPLLEVTIDRLVRFFENPARAFLQSRLALFLGDDLDPMEDREPIELNHLEQWHVGDHIVRATLCDEELDGIRPSLIAGGSLPPGSLGTFELDDIAAVATSIAAATRAKRAGELLPVMNVDVVLDGVRITGVIRDRWPAGYSRCQYSKIGGRRELAVWLHHLMINWLGDAKDSYLIGRVDDHAGIVHFAPVAQPEDLLRRFLALYRYGQSTPLPLFEGSSRIYAERYAKELRKKSAAAAHEAALNAARKKYDQDDFSDVSNVYVEQAFRDREPVTDRSDTSTPAGLTFCSIALEVYGPLFEHREVEK